MKNVVTFALAAVLLLLPAASAQAQIVPNSQLVTELRTQISVQNQLIQALMGLVAELEDQFADLLAIQEEDDVPSDREEYEENQDEILGNLIDDVQNLMREFIVTEEGEIVGFDRNDCLEEKEDIDLLIFEFENDGGDLPNLLGEIDCNQRNIRINGRYMPDYSSLQRYWDSLQVVEDSLEI